MEHHFVDALRTNNEILIKELYNSNRVFFLGFSKRYNLSIDDSIDIYQEAFIIIRKHAISGRLYHINSSLKTYLFGVGKHLIYKKLKENSTKQEYQPWLHESEDNYAEVVIDTVKTLTKEQQLLEQYFKQLGKSCQQMLTMSFYRGLTNDEIATLQGYESESVVRSQKSRCLKTLKELIKNSPLK